MKRTLCNLMIIPLVVGLIGFPVQAADAPRSPVEASQASKAPIAYPSSVEMDHDDDFPPGELQIADGAVLRPLGVASTLIGVASFIVLAPWIAMTNSGDRAAKELVKKPFDYTFCRPLGEIEDLD